jgi:hypothetical protein
MVIRIGEGSTAADRHEARVAVFREDHSSTPCGRICLSDHRPCRDRTRPEPNTPGCQEHFRRTLAGFQTKAPEHVVASPQLFRRVPVSDVHVA